jgi:hypothetical protein
MVFSRVSSLNINNISGSEFAEVKLDLLTLKDNASKISEMLKDKKNGKVLDEIIITTPSEMSEAIHKRGARKSNPLMLNFEEYTQ